MPVTMPLPVTRYAFIFSAIWFLDRITTVCIFHRPLATGKSGVQDVLAIDNHVLA
jgi:hypothetical protein